MKIKNLNQFIKESYYDEDDSYMEELPDENILGSILSECEQKTLKDFIEYLKTYNIGTINFRTCPWMKELQTSGLYFTNDKDTITDITMFGRDCDEAGEMESELVVDTNEMEATIDTITCFENSNYVIITFNALTTGEKTLWVAEIDK